MSVPIPYKITGATLDETLVNYAVYADKLLRENDTLTIHTIQIVSPGELVFFVHESEGLKVQREAMKLVQSQINSIGNAGCEHEWNNDLVCEKCGAKM